MEYTIETIKSMPIREVAYGIGRYLELVKDVPVTLEEALRDGWQVVGKDTWMQVYTITSREGNILYITPPEKWINSFMLPRWGVDPGATFQLLEALREYGVYVAIMTIDDAPKNGSPIWSMQVAGVEVYTTSLIEGAARCTLLWLSTLFAIPNAELKEEQLQLSR